MSKSKTPADNRNDHVDATGHDADESTHQVDINDWLDQLDDAIADVHRGQTYTITRNGEPVASLGPRHGVNP